MPARKSNPTLDTPDARFGVRRFKHGRGTVLIAAPAEAADLARWRAVEGTHIILVGEVDEALRGLIQAHTNKELIKLLDIQPHPLHLLRLHLGLPTGATGRGGARPNAGRKKAENTPNGGGEGVVS